jgi:hypothetical protein
VHKTAVVIDFILFEMNDIISTKDTSNNAPKVLTAEAAQQRG